MIKITVNTAVYEALHQAFPKASSAQRALNKYISLLENLLFQALQHGRTPQQCKLDSYALSLYRLATKGGQIGPDCIRLHKWLNDNNLALVQTVDKGSNLKGKLSEVKLTPLVTMTNTLEIKDNILNNQTSDQEIDIYLRGSDASNQALCELLYPDFKLDWTDAELLEVFDPVPVDVESLKNYIVWLNTEAKYLTRDQKDHALRQARIVLAVSQVFNGLYFQRKKPSEFGRNYYEGVSVQNVNKELRRAMLGNCWEYDIRSSVIAWKMGFARDCLTAQGSEQSVREAFPATTCFLEDKTDFMNTVRYFTYTPTSPILDKDYQAKRLKEAFTAISFGARLTSHGWQISPGNWLNPALVEIIKNPDDRKRFLANSTVRAFIKEQNMLDDYLYGQVKIQHPELLSMSVLQTHSGRSSKAKVLAYLYQHAETSVMNVVREVAHAKARTPIANVHDAIFFAHRLGLDLKCEIEYQMQERTGNPYWRLAPKELKRYEPRLLDVKREEQAHRARIAQEEAAAKGFMINRFVCIDESEWSSMSSPSKASGYQETGCPSQRSENKLTTPVTTNGV
nr:hypothetical protein [uncultured Limnohabitans sp.]